MDLSLSQGTLNSIGISSFGAVSAFLMAWFWYGRNQAIKKADAIADGHEKVLARLAELEAKERVNAQALTPIVTAFQAILIKQLTHSGAPELDQLLVKVGPPSVLTNDEYTGMIVLLAERSGDHAYDESERDAAYIFPAVMKMVAVEQANLTAAGSAQDLKLMTIVSVLGTETKDTDAETPPEP